MEIVSIFTEIYLKKEVFKYTTFFESTNVAKLKIITILVT
jgi:hypothetical protein